MQRIVGKKSLFAHGLSTFESFRDYFTTEIERRTGVKDGPNTTAGLRMVPVMDMINHDVRKSGFVELERRGKGGRKRKEKDGDELEGGIVVGTRSHAKLRRPLGAGDVKGRKGGGRGEAAAAIIQGERKGHTRRYLQGGERHRAKGNGVPGTMAVYLDDGGSGSREVLVNYNADGYSPLDWFNNFGFVPLERSSGWTLEPRSLVHAASHPMNRGAGAKENSEEFVQGFKEQQERSRKWREDRGIPQGNDV